VAPMRGALQRALLESTHVAANHIGCKPGTALAASVKSLSRIVSGRGCVLGAGLLALSFGWPNPGRSAVADSANAGLRVTFTGQALIKHDLREVAPEKFKSMGAALQVNRPHVLFTDLEVTIDTGVGTPKRDTQFFHATKPAVIDCLKAWGFNLLALSNNHAWDLGTPGILGTLNEVKKRGLGFAGTGATLAAASAPGYLETSQGRVALISFASGKIAEGAAATPDRAGVNEVRLREETKELDAGDVARVFDSIKAARAAGATLVIAYQHDHYWEPDNRITPEWKRVFARACIDAGADVFVSHGAPMLHGIELHRGRPIFYDLGGLVFHTITAPGYYKPEVWESVIADAEFVAGRLTALRFRPIVMNENGEGEPPSPRFYRTRGAPALATGETGRAILERLARLSAAYGTTFTFSADGSAIVLPTSRSTP